MVGSKVWPKTKGKMPPSMKISESETATVVCSMRGAMGMGGSELHVPPTMGAGSGLLKQSSTAKIQEITRVEKNNMAG